MKVAAFAITLMLGGAAIAQTTTTTHTDHTGTTTTDVSAQAGTTGAGTSVDVNADTSMTEPSTDTSVSTTTQSNTNWNTTTQSTQSNTSWNTGQTGTTMASNMTGQVVQPSNANPERDARGIRVISDPAIAPAGFNGSAGTGMGGPAADATSGAGMAADSSPPACSATVTDNCVQTYERGRSPR